MSVIASNSTTLSIYEEGGMTEEQIALLNKASSDASIAKSTADETQTYVLGIEMFEYVLDGVTIPVNKRDDGTYYYILNDEEVTVAEADLVHDENGDLKSYSIGGIYENIDFITGNIKTLDTKVNSFDARERAIYTSIHDNSLISKGKAIIDGGSLILTNDTVSGVISNLLNYLKLNPGSVVIRGNGKDIVTIAKTNDDSGFMELNGTSLLIARESRLTTIRMRSAEGVGNLAFVAGSDGHISIREVL